MKRKNSIQQTLNSAGFVIDEDNKNYVYKNIKIPALEAIGHTVDSFIEKMRRNRWMPEDAQEVEEEKTNDTPAPDFPIPWFI